MGNSDKTPVAPWARAAARQAIAAQDRDEPLSDAVARALMDARRGENEACAALVEQYIARMAAAIAKRGAAGEPTRVAECKQDAGEFILRAIRSRMEQDND